jgi:hypothetical protein
MYPGGFWDSISWMKKKKVFVYFAESSRRIGGIMTGESVLFVVVHAPRKELQKLHKKRFTLKTLS